MLDYLDKIKNLSDSLAAVGHALTDQELVFYTLRSLGPEFEPFTMTVTTRKDLISQEELHSLLLTQEHRLALSTQLSSLALSPAPPTANIATTVGRNASGRGGGSSSPHRGRGRGREHGSTSHLAASNNTSRLQGGAPTTAFSPSSSPPFLPALQKEGSHRIQMRPLL